MPEIFVLTEEQAKKRAPTKGVQCWLSARLTDHYFEYKIVPVSVIKSDIFGETVMFGVFLKSNNKRVDTWRKDNTTGSGSGHGAADCYYWIMRYGDDYIKEHAIDDILLGK